MLHETDSANNILELSDYRVGFRTERGLAKAVDGISLSLKRGSTLAIVGESGSGKTVLNRGIMGLLGANIIEGGSAKFQGEELVNTNRQKFWGTKMAMIFHCLLYTSDAADEEDRKASIRTSTFTSRDVKKRSAR